jgi:hypothetical protein
LKNSGKKVMPFIFVFLWFQEVYNLWRLPILRPALPNDLPR